MLEQLITSITHNPGIVTQLYRHRHNHLQALIILLDQLYGHQNTDQVTQVVEWVDSVREFEIDFLPTPQSNDPEAYFPHSCPIYDPIFPKLNAHRPSRVHQLTEHHEGIDS